MITRCKQPGCMAPATVLLVWGQSCFEVCDEHISKHSNPIQVLKVGESPLPVWAKWGREHAAELRQAALDRRCWNDHRE